ncbi:MAG: hypothetical protein Aurels2KO_44990 [Aureliella sp.]
MRCLTSFRGPKAFTKADTHGMRVESPGLLLVEAHTMRIGQTNNVFGDECLRVSNHGGSPQQASLSSVTLHSLAWVVLYVNSCSMP